ncbi:MAG: hypothetical protein JJ850_17930 [Kordiimonadaceae bacterium]|nr:hypothetical protein [Kordiimonadaceae bacterium]MBO6570635.1 hypothetical protein [Kordiimonadaceae bacterium]MBO6966507.1 hypothetical protein [Kordiimonadaceae bacterium]
MNDSINHEGLKRLVDYELSRLDENDPAEARRILEGKVGAYDVDGSAITAGINGYYSRVTCTLEH